MGKMWKIWKMKMERRRRRKEKEKVKRKKFDDDDERGWRSGMVEDDDGREMLDLRAQRNASTTKRSKERR